MARFIFVCLLSLSLLNSCCHGAFIAPSPSRASRLPLILQRKAIVESVSEAMKEAMKNKDKERLSALRNLRASFLTAMKEDGSDSLSDEKAIAILRKLEKMRKESIEMFKAGGREDMVAGEQVELDIISSYLPQLADESTTRKYVQEAIEASKASGPKDMGKVFGVLMKQHKDELDGNLARKIATELLAALGK